jgi:magnesium chelatase family protein
MFIKLHSLGIIGINSFDVDVEVDITTGVPAFDIVGLPDASVKESRDRVRSALKNSGFEFPIHKITVNLAPADVKKSGSLYELPILLGILLATGQIVVDIKDTCFIGELSLNGDIRPVNGVLPMVIQAKESGMKRIFVPSFNAYEGAVVSGIEVYGVSSIFEIVSFLEGQAKLSPISPIKNDDAIDNFAPDFSEVKGQIRARRALEIAAAGGHNALMIGAPGSGKSMLAKRLPSILPDMSFEESIQTSKIHSIAGLLTKENPLVTVRPFRSPHHTISPNGLSGGGTLPRPGELSIAHNGVLFLDELPEFARNTKEILRQPIEDGAVTISRVNGVITYPCSIMLIAAMNPCPCGNYGHPTKACTCSPTQVSRYLSRVSGPLLDRLDLHIDVSPVEYQELSSSEKSESSLEIKKRVNNARAIQHRRFEGLNVMSNSRILPSMLREFCRLTPAGSDLLKAAFDKLGLSARAYDRILKVSRTIADLENSEVIEAEHIAEAIAYRSLDRKYWN